MPPPFAPGENADALARSGKPPRITSPKPDVVYSTPASGAPALTADTDADVTTIYWFADREFLGTSERSTPLSWQPRPGTYTIVAMNGDGRSDSRAVACVQ